MARFKTRGLGTSNQKPVKENEVNYKEIPDLIIFPTGNDWVEYLLTGKLPTKRGKRQ